MLVELLLLLADGLVPLGLARAGEVRALARDEGATERVEADGLLGARHEEREEGEGGGRTERGGGDAGGGVEEREKGRKERGTRMGV
jgi:hypothetical protein